MHMKNLKYERTIPKAKKTFLTKNLYMKNIKCERTIPKAKKNVFLLLYQSLRVVLYRPQLYVFWRFADLKLLILPANKTIPTDATMAMKNASKGMSGLRLP